MRIPRRIPMLALLWLAALSAACGRGGSPDWAAVTDVTPAALDTVAALHASIASDGQDRVALTWVTRDPAGGFDLWLALSDDGGTRFGEARRVNERPGAVASLAEARPLAAFGRNGAFAVAWTGRREGGGHATDVWVTASGNGGATLGAAVRVNDDAEGRPAYHGFPALGFAPDGALLVAWMDERHAPPGGGEPSSASLYLAVSRDQGATFGPNRPLTDRLCPCCRVAIATAEPGRVAIAYRSAGGDIRDPALLLSTDNGGTFPFDTVIASDGWSTTECPVDGPALVATGGGGRLAWYTAARGPAVHYASFRGDSAAIAIRAEVAGLHRPAHPRLAPLGAAALLAVEGSPAADTTRRALAVALVNDNGSLTPWVLLGREVHDGWLAATGPRAALASWSEGEEPRTRVRLARLERR